MSVVRVGLLLLLVHLSVLTFAQVTSTFDVDTDGWTLSDNNLTDPQTVTYNPTGGNPGGYISGTKISTSQPYYWTSPAQFGGNIAYFSYGQDLSFDIQVNYAGTSHFSTGDVQIRTSSGSTLVYTLPGFPAQAPAWSTFTVRLDETAGWRVSSTGGPLASKAQILQFLSGVHSFRININYRSGVTSPTGAIDNIILGQRSIPLAPTIDSFSPLSGSPGTSITISGGNFDPTPSNNAIYFGGMAGTITNASATSLTVTVPQGATYGPLTVINKTTGKAKISTKPFVPTFENGGRIIPASFDPKFDIVITGGYGGLALADIDGDGWNDLVTASEDNSGIGIYRNLGSGGDLSAASFAARVDFLTGGSGANGSGLSVIDLDGDGKLDMVTSIARTAFQGSFVTYRNISTPGNLAFEAVEYWDGKSDECPVYNAVDIDGDGLPELVGGEGAGAAGQNVWITPNISSPGNIEFGFSLFYFPSALDDAASGATISDLNNDGRPEFILIRAFGGAFTVFENTSAPGALSFGTNFSITASIQGEINVADFNGDDKMDIAWKDGNSNDDVHILINTDTDGALTLSDFATEIILDSDVSTYGALSIGDINGDGKPDIMATDNADLGIFENVYTGGVFNSSAFVPGFRFQGNGGSTYPSAGVAGDLNGDNRPDIVVGITNTNPNRLSIYENINERAPEISLNTVSPLKGPIGSTVIITGDYFSTTPSENVVQFGSVHANVVAATQTQLTVTVPPGANYGPVRVTRNQFTASYHLPFNPTFSAGVTFNSSHFALPVSFTLTGGDYDIDMADLNGDGKPDIVAEATNRAYSFRNTHTTGPITTSSLLADDSTIANAQNPRLIDLNGDNKPEIIGSNGVFRNISAGSEITFEALTNIGGVLTAQPTDFNRDGKFDYVGASGSAEVTLFENRMRQGTGPFLTGTYGSLSLNVDYPKPAVGGGPVAADFDNDGWMDMACGNGTTDNLTVWRNNGNYRVNLSTFTSVGNFATGDNPGRLYTGDLDVDGKMDIVLYHGAGTSSTMISVFHNTTTAVISFNRVDYTIPTAGTLAWISDLDGDGKPEILVTSETGNRIIILKNVSSPGILNTSSFAVPFSITVTSPRGLATADINLDGKPEILVNTAANTLLVLENLVPTASITVTSQPGGITNRCEGDDYPFSTDATGTTNITYQWQKFNPLSSLFENLVNGGAFSNVNTKNLQITNMQTTESGDYRCLIQGDLAAPVFSDTATLIVNALPPEPVTTNGARCGPGQVILTASNGVPGEYVWYFDDLTGEPIPDENDPTYTTDVLTITTVYYVSIASGLCETARVPVTAIINPIPVKPVISSNVSPVGNTVTVCSSTTLLLSAPTGFASYLWSDGSTTEQITVVANGTYTVTVTNAELCTSPASDALNVVIIPAPCNNQAPVISPTVTAVPIEGVVTIEVLDLITDPDNNLDLTSLRVVTSTSQQGASASINGSNQLVLDYGNVPFTGMDHVTIEVCDLFGECTQQELTIEVVGDITVHNAFSPNGDGMNEIFLIEYIQLFSDTQENHVAIFNRWGDEVFSISNYNNNDRVFRGMSNSGKELVTGTYFYKIEFTSGRAMKTGYLSLKR